MVGVRHEREDQIPINRLKFRWINELKQSVYRLFDRYLIRHVGSPLLLERVEVGLPINCHAAASGNTAHSCHESNIHHQRQRIDNFGLLAFVSQRVRGLISYSSH